MAVKKKPFKSTRPAPKPLSPAVKPEPELTQFMTGDLGVAKVKAPKPVVVEAPVLVQTPAERAFGDPVPVEVVESSGLGTAAHRANCDPPSSRT